MSQIYALVDCNNFYASCERVFNPALEGKPVVVLSNNDGCIIARSAEAKKLGIKMADPFFRIKSLVAEHKIQVFSANFTLYGDMSARVMNTLAENAPKIEIYSIDEAFLDLSEIPENKIVNFAKNLRAKVKKNVGIPVSIGIGPTRTLAKLANKLAKQKSELEGVCNLLGKADISQDLKEVEVGGIWGVGFRTTHKLQGRGVKTALDFINLTEYQVYELMHTPGVKTQRELKGQACIEVGDVREDKKTIMSTRSFGRPVMSIYELEEAISTYVARAAEKLRAQNSAALAITVYLTTNYFSKTDEQHYGFRTITFPTATSYTPDIIKQAKVALHSIYKNGLSYKKAGVILSGLVSQTTVQSNLFETQENEIKKKNVMKVVDVVNKRFGYSTLSTASEGRDKLWGMRRQMCSPRYTTKWAELPVVF